MYEYFEDLHASLCGFGLTGLDAGKARSGSQDGYALPNCQRLHGKSTGTDHQGISIC